MAKMTGFDSNLHDYLDSHRSVDESLLDELRAETLAKLGKTSGMQISPGEGRFLRMLVGALGARRILEVGTFTGYSALCMALGQPPDGELLCCDVSEEWTGLAREYWKRAGVSDRIDLRLGPAVETLKGLPQQESFDFAFVDADKVNYANYYNEIIPRLRTGSLMAIDNVLWGGSVVDNSRSVESTEAIRAVNDLVTADERTENVMLAVADGLMLIRKR